MENLDVYQRYFDKAYPGYADTEYAEISKLINGLPTDNVASEILNTDNTNRVLSLIVPLIRIKNYKSQIPFPTELFDAVKLIVKIKNSDTSESFPNDHIKLFNDFIMVKGFQLPTISAVLHFCHPKTYPIVDRNVVAACSLLLKKFPDELKDYPLPKLPVSTTTPKNKLEKYRAFITFLNEIKKLHNVQHHTNYEFHDLDKALMVYGVPGLKSSAEEQRS